MARYPSVTNGMTFRTEVQFIDVLFSVEAAKGSIELVSALAKLVEDAKRSNHPSLQQILKGLAENRFALRVVLNAVWTKLPKS